MRHMMGTLDAGDRRAAAAGGAAGLGLVTMLALRADWVLASGILLFRRTGTNVAAYLMGLDLLPWTLVFTAVTAGLTIAAASYACARPKHRPAADLNRRQARRAGRRISLVNT